MDYLNNAFRFTIEIIANLYMTLMILRCIFQFAKVNFNNSISQSLVKLTNPPLNMFRRLIPKSIVMRFGIRFESIILILVIAVIKNMFLISFFGNSINFFGVFLVGLGDSLNMVIWILLITIIMKSIVNLFFSSVNYPTGLILNELSEYILRPFRCILPSFMRVNGIDLSPLLAIFSFNIFQYLISYPIIDAGKMMLAS